MTYDWDLVGVDVDRVHLLADAAERGLHAQLGEVGPHKSVRVLGDLVSDVRYFTSKQRRQHHQMNHPRDSSSLVSPSGLSQAAGKDSKQTPFQTN